MGETVRKSSLVLSFRRCLKEALASREPANPIFLERTGSNGITAIRSGLLLDSILDPGLRRDDSVSFEQPPVSCYDRLFPNGV